MDEPLAAQDYANVLSQVARAGQAVIVRRDGKDIAAVIPVEHLELLREILARHEAEKLAEEIDWARGEQEAAGAGGGIANGVDSDLFARLP